jgi:hypothetical protein
MSRHQPVAFAGRFLERRSADNTNDPASIGDRPAAVKRSGGDAGHIGARHAKHLRKRLLGERQFRLPEPSRSCVISSQRAQRASSGCDRTVAKMPGQSPPTFSWKESGCPRVLPPTRKGFGRVILRDAAKQFGAVTMNHLPDGLLYQLKLDLKGIEAPSNVVTLPITPIQRPA